MICNTMILYQAEVPNPEVEIRRYTCGRLSRGTRAPCVGVYVTRYAAASAAAYVGQDRRLHVWREYRYTRLHVWPRILAKIRAGTE